MDKGAAIIFKTLLAALLLGGSAAALAADTDGLPTGKAPSQHASLRWLGEPDEATQQLLQEQLKNDPNWY